MSPTAGVRLGVLSAVVLGLVACLGSGGNQASRTNRDEGGTSSVHAPTTTPPVATVTETSTGPGSGEQPAVTGLADVLTTTVRGTDVMPRTAPPWHKERAVCRTHSFRLVYDRDVPAILVLRGNDVLAWAGLYRRDVNDECRKTQGQPPIPNADEVPEGVYESLELHCDSPERIRVDAHAIEMNSSVYGSQIYITSGARWLASAVVVEEVEGRRIYFNSDYCSRA